MSEESIPIIYRVQEEKKENWARRQRRNVAKLKELWKSVTIPVCPRLMEVGLITENGPRQLAQTACSAQCGGGRQTRRRSCSNPAPTFGGADCVGKAEESQKCNTKQCPGNCEQITIISFISKINILSLMNKMKSSNSKTVPCDFMFTVIISLYVFLNLILKHWTFWSRKSLDAIPLVDFFLDFTHEILNSG